MGTGEWIQAPVSDTPLSCTEACQAANRGQCNEAMLNSITNQEEFTEVVTGLGIDTCTFFTGYGGNEFVPYVEGGDCSWSSDASAKCDAQPPSDRTDTTRLCFCESGKRS